MRIGIIGTGRIAQRFLDTNKKYELFEVSGFYKPSLGIDFDEFIESVDAVYIASPHGTHPDYVKKTLLAGKHVLCEKPMCFSSQDAKELFNLALTNNLILMEALKTSYCPGFKELEKVVASGAIGDVKDVEAAFTKLTSYDGREMQDKEYGGSLFELGSYVLFPIMRFLGTKYDSVRYMSVPAENGKDWFTKVSIEYSNNSSKNAQFGLAKTGLGVKTEGEMIISGTKGYIIVKAPWWMTTHFEVRYEDPNKVDVYDIPYEGSGMQYEMQEFLERIEGKPRESWVGITEEECCGIADILEKKLSI